MIVDGSSGDVRESWTGDQVAWPMARGYEGQFGHVLNAPYVWLPLCAIFSSASSTGAVHGGSPTSTCSRCSPSASRTSSSTGARSGSRCRSSTRCSPTCWRGCSGSGFAAARASTRLPCGLARDRRRLSDRLPGDDQRRRLRGDRRRLRGDGGRGPHRPRPADLRRGRVPRGQPLRRHVRALQLLRVRTVRAGAWSGEWDELAASHAAAIAFDLATVAGLFVFGPRLRPGRAGRELGAILAFAWVAYPYTAFALQSNSNDSLIAALLVWSLVLFARPLARGALLASRRSRSSRR